MSIKKRAPKRASETRKEQLMNYFGMIFSFMLPGMAIGGMAATLINEAARKRRKARKHR